MRLNSKRIFSSVSAAVFAVALCAFIITLSISIPIYCRGFYYAQIEPLNISEESSASVEEIKQAYDSVLDYLTKSDVPFSSGVFKHSKDGAAHFAACKKLFTLNSNVLLLSLTVILVLLCLKGLKVAEPIKVGKRTVFLYSGIFIFSLVAIVGFFAIFFFDEAFVIFHQVAFSNQDNWILGIRRDSIVEIFPQQFFFNCAVLIVGTIILLSLLATVFDFLYARKERKMEILKLKPAFKDYLWGGKILKQEYSVDNMDKVAEAWVLSAHKDGQSQVANGKYSGLTFSEAIEKMGKAALGKKAQKFEDFPQLIKLIDAEDNLSVQVHPSDEYALQYEGQYGKTEMWYILDAKENAGIYYGFKEEITAEEFEEHIKNNTLTDVLRFVPVKKSECYFIPSGTIHAIGKGLLIAEIQQNSNVTYRVYDYGRVGADGKPRDLHIEKATAVTKLSVAEQNTLGQEEKFFDGTKELLSSCKYFTVSRIKMNGKAKLFQESSFIAMLVLSGEGEIEGQAFEKNDTFFIPANKTAMISGKFEALISTL